VATTQSYRVISDEHIQIFRRQQDDLLAHVKGNAYFENHGHQHKDTGYYVNLPKKTHAPIKFIQANDTYFWVRLLFRDNAWITNQGGILKTRRTLSPNDKVMLDARNLRVNTPSRKLSPR